MDKIGYAGLFVSLKKSGIGVSTCGNVLFHWANSTSEDTFFLLCAVRMAPLIDTPPSLFFFTQEWRVNGSALTGGPTVICPISATKTRVVPVETTKFEKSPILSTFVHGWVQTKRLLILAKASAEPSRT